MKQIKIAVLEFEVDEGCESCEQENLVFFLEGRLSKPTQSVPGYKVTDVTVYDEVHAFLVDLRDESTHVMGLEAPEGFECPDPPPPRTWELVDDHGMFFVQYSDGEKQLCNYLMNFANRGVYEPNVGKVDLTPEQVSKHNSMLDAAMLKGLDGCEIGQSGQFYTSKEGGQWQVRTFCGAVVSNDVTVRGLAITFRRNDMVFNGHLDPEADLDLFEFERVE